MTIPEAQAYFDKLDAKEATRFNLLVGTYLRLGKPIEGAYEAAHTIMEEDNDDSTETK